MKLKMKSPKIIAHCLVKNEERFIWYAINSVLPYVDKIMVWDTGSTDKTVKIIKSIKSKKVHFKQLKSITSAQFPHIRQQMLDQTPKNYTWIMVLDGDEIWPEISIKKATDFCRTHPQYESVVVRTNNLVGDIYHRLPQSAGHYHIAGHKGHLNLRFMNTKVIPGLNVQKPHGQQGYYDNSNALIQNRDPKKIKFLDVYYHHATHLIRSHSRHQDKQVIKRAFKFKYELGQAIPKTQMPKIFFSKHPSIVPKVTAQASLKFWLLASIFTPIKRLKRVLIPPATGY